MSSKVIKEFVEEYNRYKEELKKREKRNLKHISFEEYLWLEAGQEVEV